MAITIDGAGTITGLDADGISAQPVFAGQVLQVVQGSTSTEVSTTSETLVSTGLSASITPSSTSSKILVLVSQPFSTSRDNTEFANILEFTVEQNGSLIYDPSMNGNLGGKFGESSQVMFLWVLHASVLASPATTSAVTYETKMRCRVNSSNASVSAQKNGADANIILMEIAG